MINGHALYPPLSFVAAIPCRPGAAVQVERLQRSEDGQPGRPLTTVGGHLMRPPRSRHVAEHRATAAPDPLFGAAAVIKLARAGDRADKGVMANCTALFADLLACLSRRPVGKRLDQFGRHVALVISPVRRLRARKSWPAR